MTSTISRGLFVAPRLLDADERTIDWTVTFAAVQRSLRQPDSRAARLKAIRDEIAAAATHITTDESVAATRRLAQLLGLLASESHEQQDQH